MLENQQKSSILLQKQGFFQVKKSGIVGSKGASFFGACVLGIFHGIHAAWNEATRDAPETKNDIKESLSKKN